MLKIRLQRVGRKNQPTYRVVLVDSRRSTKTGNVIEVLGWRNPEKHTDSFKTDRITHWLGKGAQATGSMHNLLLAKKIIQGKKVNVSPRKYPEKAAADAAKEESAPEGEKGAEAPKAPEAAEAPVVEVEKKAE